MYKIDIKPLSVNQAMSVFRGMKIKTRIYRQFEKDCLAILPKIVVPNDCYLTLRLKFNISRDIDIDNMCKPFIDVLQRAYEFNDKMIYTLNVDKLLVKKGEESIEFSFISVPPYV